MSTQFFDRQAKARKNTALLVLMFGVSLVVMVVAIFLLVAFVSQFASVSRTGGAADPFLDGLGSAELWRLPRPALQYGLIGGAIAAVVISLGTLYKVVALRSGGGRSVAESIGGRRLSPDSQDFHERRVLNVVEEMAIASGTPVPPVFLLDEPAINAFAAGYSPSDAVVGVTRGAIDHLSREELQGVIAHEFSHILNGDMRMNIRMIGILHGILLLTLVGKLIFRSMLYSGHGRRRSGGDGKSQGGAVLIILGVAIALLIIGSLGSLIGGLLKAAVSRQREYLADASAVQFTRHPGGIAGALKKLGGIRVHGRLEHPGAPVASHMFFGQGVFEGFTGLMATHPALPRRILAIEPNWDGVFPVVTTTSSRPGRSPIDGASGLAGDEVDRVGRRPPSDQVPSDQVTSDQVPVPVVKATVDHIGEPLDYHRVHATRLIAQLDPEVLRQAREPYSVRAVVLALLLDHDPGIRKKQLQIVALRIDDAVARLSGRLGGVLDALGDESRLPLIDLCLPALAAISPRQYQQFIAAFDEMVAADDKISLFEWTLAQVLRRHLRPHFHPVGRQMVTHYGLQRLTGEVSTLLSVVARVGESDPDRIEASFAAGVTELNVPARLLTVEQCDLNRLHQALVKLNRSSEKIRGRIIDACAAIVCDDQKVVMREAELLRGIADLLDCPVPPLVVDQSTV